MKGNKIMNAAKFAPKEQKKYSNFAHAIANKLYPDDK